MTSLKAFVIDYIERHAHPANAVLHIIGVPSVFWGLYLLFLGKPSTAFALIFFGYFLQYLGHRTQGNEVGEVTLIKHLWLRLTKKGA